MATPLSSLLLSAVVVCALADAVLGLKGAGLVGAPFLLLYMAREWTLLMRAARILIGLCAVLAVLTVVRPDGLPVLMKAASRMIYFPAFVAVLGLLRAAASRSETTAAAGRYLVTQPPSRRYLAMTLGGHFFGILFNIGGLALLIDMIKKANTLETAGGQLWVQELRERRMVVAVMRGFSCIALWSPLGVALNLLLASMPGLTWSEVAPYGVALTICFMTLGWIFDRLESPPSRSNAARPTEPRGALAVLRVIGHVVALSMLGLLAETFVDLPFQALLLVLVPIYAFGWAILIEVFERRPKPVQAAASVLHERGVARFGSYANEIAVFSTSGFLGVVLVALSPRDAIQAWITASALPPGVVAVGLALTVFCFGFLSINPIITASILAGTFATIDVPGLSKVDVVIALAGGWTCVIAVGPAMSSLVMISGQLGRPSSQVGLGWNSRFSFSAFALLLVGLYFIRL